MTRIGVIFLKINLYVIDEAEQTLPVGKSAELGDRDDTALQKDVGLMEEHIHATANADENEEEDDILICSQNYKRPTPEPAMEVDHSNGKLYY